MGLKDWYWWVLKGDEIEGKIGKKEVPKLNGKPKLQPSWNLGSTFGQKSEVFMEYNQSTIKDWLKLGNLITSLLRNLITTKH